MQQRFDEKGDIDLIIIIWSFDLGINLSRFGKE